MDGWCILGICTDITRMTQGSEFVASLQGERTAQNGLEGFLHSSSGRLLKSDLPFLYRPFH